MRKTNRKPIKLALSPVTRINNLLKKAGRLERLVRGRGYYYMIGGDAMKCYSTSIYVCWLEKTEADFAFARREVNEIFARAYQDGRISDLVII